MGSDQVIALARERFVARERVEVGEIAAAAGVNRSTVYRRFHGRDGLLVEVIWSLAEVTIDAAIRRARGVGPERITSMMWEFALLANRAEHIRDFLNREPERALRLLTTRSSGVQPRIVNRLIGILDEEVSAGRLVPPVPTPDLALILVRITETFVYGNVAGGDEPDAEKVRQACGALLGAVRHPDGSAVVVGV
ncbi:QsdR family transcriptional regulator [Gordonia zhaorongruii]|uniref:QsdR family transcriptional regulator n=1 Tax=Gordonia zhaorongruii TaxID=2597659 RepID=UPI00117BE4D8|nr:QsdR family transcriptional regulator [Gordonia zhaorongruii]